MVSAQMLFVLSPMVAAAFVGKKITQSMTTEEDQDDDYKRAMDSHLDASPSPTKKDQKLLYALNDS